MINGQKTGSGLIIMRSAASLVFIGLLAFLSQRNLFNYYYYWKRLFGDRNDNIARSTNKEALISGSENMFSCHSLQRTDMTKRVQYNFRDYLNMFTGVVSAVQADKQVLKTCAKQVLKTCSALGVTPKSIQTRVRKAKVYHSWNIEKVFLKDEIGKCENNLDRLRKKFTAQLRQSQAFLSTCDYIRFARSFCCRL